MEPRSPAACTHSSMKNEPLEGNLHYGTEDREFPDRDPIQPDLLPTQLNLLRWKLNQKAKREPRFRFYALYDRIYRPDVLEAAWKLVGKYGKAAGVDGITREKLEATVSCNCESTWFARTPAMMSRQESRTVEISPYGLTRGVGLTTHSYSTSSRFSRFTSTDLLASAFQNSRRSCRS